MGRAQLHSRKQIECAVGTPDGAEGCKFITILKSVRSVQTEERFEELPTECESFWRDAILLNETWRAQDEEIVRLESGHHWFGSGGTSGKHGVGILLNR